jgi:hypothetical protein
MIYECSTVDVSKLAFDASDYKSISFASSHRYLDLLVGYIASHLVEDFGSSYRFDVTRHKTAEIENENPLGNKQVGRILIKIGYGQYKFTTLSGDACYAVYQHIGEPVTGDCGGPDFMSNLIIFTTSLENFASFLSELVALTEKTEDNKFVCYTWLAKHQYWREDVRVNSRPVESVVLPKIGKDRLLGDISKFLSAPTKDFYYRNGIPYRRSYLFHGIPGTGKTSMVCALAGHFQRNVCFLLPTHPDMTDDSLREAISSLPPNSIVVLEDIDSLFTKDRKNKAETNSLTFSGLLNALDGIGSPNGQLFILTTNLRENLDHALIRNGRVDVHIEFTYAIPEQMEQMWKNFYPAATALSSQFAEAVMESLKQHNIEITTSSLQHFFILQMDSSPEEALSNVSTIIDEIHKNSSLSMLTAATKKQDGSRTSDKKKNNKKKEDNRNENEQDMIGFGDAGPRDEKKQSKTTSDSEHEGLYEDKSPRVAGGGNEFDENKGGRDRNGGDRKRNKDTDEPTDSRNVGDSLRESSNHTTRVQKQKAGGEDNTAEDTRANGSDKLVNRKQMGRNFDQTKGLNEDRKTEKQNNVQREEQKKSEGREKNDDQSKNENKDVRKGQSKDRRSEEQNHGQKREEQDNGERRTQSDGQNGSQKGGRNGEEQRRNQTKDQREEEQGNSQRREQNGDWRREPNHDQNKDQKKPMYRDQRGQEQGDSRRREENGDQRREQNVNQNRYQNKYQNNDQNKGQNKEQKKPMYRDQRGEEQGDSPRRERSGDQRREQNVDQNRYQNKYQNNDQNKGQKKPMYSDQRGEEQGDSRRREQNGDHRREQNVDQNKYQNNVQNKDQNKDQNKEQKKPTNRDEKQDLNRNRNEQETNQNTQPLPKREKTARPNSVKMYEKKTSGENAKAAGEESKFETKVGEVAYNRYSTDDGKMVPKEGEGKNQKGTFRKREKNDYSSASGNKGIADQQ